MNILSQTRKDEINKGRKVRIYITSLWTTFATLILCSIFLLPAYIIVDSKLDEINKRREINAKAMKEQTDILNAPMLINQKVALSLQSVNTAPISDRVIRVASSVNGGINMTEVTYSKNDDKGAPHKITIRGIAINRESLITFEKLIRNIEFVESTFIPVGDFAKDRNLSFTMTVNIKTK